MSAFNWAVKGVSFRRADSLPGKLLPPEVGKRKCVTLFISSCLDLDNQTGTWVLDRPFRSEDVASHLEAIQDSSFLIALSLALIKWNSNGIYQLFKRMNLIYDFDDVVIILVSKTSADMTQRSFRLFLGWRRNVPHARMTLWSHMASSGCRLGLASDRLFSSHCLKVAKEIMSAVSSTWLLSY